MKPKPKSTGRAAPFGVPTASALCSRKYLLRKLARVTEIPIRHFKTDYLGAEAPVEPRIAAVQLGKNIALPVFELLISSRVGRL